MLCNRVFLKKERMVEPVIAGWDGDSALVGVEEAWLGFRFGFLAMN